MSEILKRAADEAASAIMRFKAKTAGRYYPGYHEDMREAVKKAILASGVAAGSSSIEERDRQREAIKLVVEYDDLLRTFTGPIETITKSDNAAIDAAYDKMIEAALAALSTLPQHPHPNRPVGQRGRR